LAFEPLPEPLPDDDLVAAALVAEAFGLEARAFLAGAAAAVDEAVDLADDDFLAGMFFDNYN
jgi:hypothetical protein